MGFESLACRFILAKVTRTGIYYSRRMELLVISNDFDGKSFLLEVDRYIETGLLRTINHEEQDRFTRLRIWETGRSRHCLESWWYRWI